MQTTFTPEQLRDPKTAEANAILRSCVHCGFCTATCPTYQVLGDELDSPRGRIYLIKDMLENERVPDDKTVTHLDRCLGCLACMTTCPSGVHYGHLIDQARGYIEKNYERPVMDRLLRWTLARILPYPGRFRLALLAAKLGKPMKGLMPDKRLRAMLEMAPAKIPPVSRNDDPQVFPALGERRMRVGLSIGCAQRALDTDINDATIRLLTRLGCEVVIPEGVGCCGALTEHMGKHDEARGTASKLIRSMSSIEGLDAVVINTSGCGTTMKDYGHMFAGHEMEAEAARIGGLCRDVSEIVTQLGLPEGTQATPLRVAYHAACSLQHGQKLKVGPKALLKQAGFEVFEPADSHLCCGSAGTYNLMQPEISAELRSRKVEPLEVLKPQVIAAGNTGCMMQIGRGTGVPVVHSVQLLDWATGGPQPSAISKQSA